MRLTFLMCVFALVAFPVFAQETDASITPRTVAHDTSKATKPSSTEVASIRPGDILLRARTICIETKTDFFTPETLERSLMGEKDFTKLGLVIVKDKGVADLVIQIDRPLFTHQRTYTVFDPKTTIVFVTGNVRAFDGTLASGPIAKQLIQALLKQKTDAAAANVQAAAK
jgi:hypothetical protein